ncbi:MAG: dTMP kinase [Deltaproteobacteria bacterium]|nr:dTMP kinase [Deltaproteobacteria bacterium]
MTGFFITFEGIEGCGKSTHVAALAQSLLERGYDVVATREPGGTATGQTLRQILLHSTDAPLAKSAELLLMLADRAQHVEEVVASGLRAGKVVISDRFADSTLAYQGHGRGIEHDLLLRLNDFACGGYKPDLTFLLDLSVEEGLRRAGKRRGTTETVDHFEAESAAFHERVRQGFLSVAHTEPSRVRVIDSLRPLEEISQEILALVLTRLADHGPRTT